jgi:hypothetical protein
MTGIPSILIETFLEASEAFQFYKFKMKV